MMLTGPSGPDHQGTAVCPAIATWKFGMAEIRDYSPCIERFEQSSLEVSPRGQFAIPA